jgi:hypothetical protein
MHTYILNSQSIYGLVSHIVLELSSNSTSLWIKVFFVLDKILGASLEVTSVNLRTKNILYRFYIGS